jgi:hypothetical protein
MAKTCKSCGKEYKGEFCEHCGYGNPNLKIKAAKKYKKSTTPVRFMTPEQKAEYYEELKKKRQEGGKKKRDPKMVRLLIVLIIVALLVVFGTLYRSGVIGFNEQSTDVVEKYLDAINDRDFDSYVSCFPKEMRKDYENDLEETGYSEKEYMEAFNADFAEEYGSDFKIGYEIQSAKTITEYSTDGYTEAYGTTPDISEANIVIVDVTFKGSEGEETFRMDCYVGKVGRHWKLFYMQYEAGTITTDMEIANPEDYTDDEDTDVSSAEEATADSQEIQDDETA